MNGVFESILFFNNYNLGYFYPSPKKKKNFDMPWSSFFFMMIYIYNKKNRIFYFVCWCNERLG